MKKPSSFLVTFCLCCSAIAMFQLQSCTPAAKAADSPVLHVVFPYYNQLPPDLAKVETALSELVEPKIQARIHLDLIPRPNWEVEKNIRFAKAQPIDLLISGSLPVFKLYEDIGQDRLLPLDQLLAEHGRNISAAFDPAYLDSGRVHGKLYLVPTIRDFARGQSILLQQEVLAELGVPPDSTVSLDELERILYRIRQKHPDSAVMVAQPQLVAGHLFSWDPLGSGPGVLMDWGNAGQVVNQYKSPNYLAILRLVRSWYQAGIIHRDITTLKDDWTTLIQNREIQGLLSDTKPGYQEQQSLASGIPLAEIRFAQPFATTESVTKFGWVIPRQSSHPDLAMKFLDLLYSDPAVYNLLCFGLENEHYQKIGDTVRYPQGQTAATVGYSFAAYGWLLGNQFIGHVFEGNSPDLWVQTARFNAQARKSSALGFAFNPAAVQTQFDACQKILSFYLPQLENGALDPDATLAELSRALDEAGAAAVIREKQAQIDQWRAERRKP